MTSCEKPNIAATFFEHFIGPFSISQNIYKKITLFFIPIPTFSSKVPSFAESFTKKVMQKLLNIVFPLTAFSFFLSAILFHFSECFWVSCVLWAAEVPRSYMCFIFFLNLRVIFTTEVQFSIQKKSWCLKVVRPFLSIPKKSLAKPNERLLFWKENLKTGSCDRSQFFPPERSARNKG